ncbi:MAG: hypothetical protein KAH32_07165 [Chlamydiia bacterium]|nr:hypothetical protein [Chlamydiia bacterium]
MIYKVKISIILTMIMISFGALNCESKGMLSEVSAGLYINKSQMIKEASYGVFGTIKSIDSYSKFGVGFKLGYEFGSNGSLSFRDWPAYANYYVGESIKNVTLNKCMSQGIGYKTAECFVSMYFAGFASAIGKKEYYPNQEGRPILIFAPMIGVSYQVLCTEKVNEAFVDKTIFVDPKKPTDTGPSFQYFYLTPNGVALRSFSDKTLYAGIHIELLMSTGRHISLLSDFEAYVDINGFDFLKFDFWNHICSDKDETNYFNAERKLININTMIRRSPRLSVSYTVSFLSRLKGAMVGLSFGIKWTNRHEHKSLNDSVLTNPAEKTQLSEYPVYMKVLNLGGSSLFSTVKVYTGLSFVCNSF